MMNLMKAHESMKQFMEMKNDMMEENEESIDKAGLLELECFK
jgi:hypothetical protein